MCPTTGASAQECSALIPHLPSENTIKQKLLSNQKLRPSPWRRYFARSVNSVNDFSSRITWKVKTTNSWKTLSNCSSSYFGSAKFWQRHSACLKESSKNYNLEKNRPKKVRTQNPKKCCQLLLLTISWEFQLITEVFLLYMNINKLEFLTTNAVYLLFREN